eukprot:gene2751-3532_t
MISTEAAFHSPALSPQYCAFSSNDSWNRWLRFPHIKGIIVKGKGGKAFCAGGDVRTVCEQGRAGEKENAIDFFRREYKLNYKISQIEKPYIALIDGICMGGGAGLSVHGNVRIASEKTVFAMPECAIGFFPDVGGSYYLPRLQGNLGIMLGLTGYNLKGRDVVLSGLANYYVASHLMAPLQFRIQEVATADAEVLHTAITEFEALEKDDPIPDDSVFQHIEEIERIFGAPTVEGIAANLAAKKQECAGLKDEEFWTELDKGLAKGAPVSLKVTLKLLREGARMPLRECLIREFRLAYHFMHGTSFYDGVTSQLITKDKNPQWEYKTLEEVTPEIVDHYFSPIPEKEELVLPEEKREKTRGKL